MKITIKRVGKPDPYMPYKDRCQFAVETMVSIGAPRHEQILELELMMRDEDE
jgi:hypothetical protein